MRLDLKRAILAPRMPELALDGEPELESGSLPPPARLERPRNSRGSYEVTGVVIVQANGQDILDWESPG
jgi:hypothetical protein